MKISEKKYVQFLNIFLLLISLCLPFGKLSNIAIIIFCCFNLLFFNKNRYEFSAWKASVFMLIPLILEILFFWNNDSFSLGLKSLEKYISLLFFGFFIILQYKLISVNNLLRYYALGMVLILLFLEIRFIFIRPDLFEKYRSGIHLWEAGYEFTNSFNVHAPALNFQLSFVVCVSYYFLINSFTKQFSNLQRILNLIVFILSFAHVLIVNTRISLLCVILGCLFITYYEIKNKFEFKKLVYAFTLFISVVSLLLFITVKNNPFMIEKYTNFTFKNLDKVGKLDELENPEAEAFNGLVNRLSIWKSAIAVANTSPIIGVGSSDANPMLFKYYEDSNQKFLTKYNFPVHNQYINFYLKFGVFGIIGIGLYLFNLLKIGLKLKSSIVISFLLVFLISNLTDDFLNRFDGIGFSSFFYSIMIVIYLQGNFYKSPASN